MEVAHKVLQTMLTPVGLDNGEHVSMGASIGVAMFLGGTVESLPNLVDRTDKALYESKRNGKGKASNGAIGGA